MQLKCFRHLWGVAEAWESAFPRIKARGYAGIETPIPRPADHPRLRALLNQHDFALIPMIFTAGDTVGEHVASFRRQCESALFFQPLLINAHSGRDSWSEAEAEAYFKEALAIEQDLGVPVAHETHRGRILYTPWVTRRLLETLPQLHLCCDFSHWVCIAERLIHDQLPAIRLAAERARHVHARVGYEQGPQVPDPRAPAYAPHVAAHETWWELVWQSHLAQGCEFTTLTPEYGPPPYLHSHPLSGEPVADLWEVCEWQTDRLAARFAAQFGG